jgi:hypothetical protein
MNPGQSVSPSLRFLSACVQTSGLFKAALLPRREKTKAPRGIALGMPWAKERPGSEGARGVILLPDYALPVSASGIVYASGRGSEHVHGANGCGHGKRDGNDDDVRANANGVCASGGCANGACASGGDVDARLVRLFLIQQPRRVLPIAATAVQRGPEPKQRRRSARMPK